ncbi:hypothetical protein KYI11_09980 [Macrococcoides bohemicum]|uniref:Glutamate synthase domain-containing protein n=1 Tax=Macrococcoides bohemicum TaxID=1903056 RepID=A0AAJ4PCQ4_9STAP|nr:hypothetical protein KYI11_09980 [Macrococcus bohemicus]QYA45997.1 hypothetical protein KYI13_09900 [Macrococcus bohemicus]
MVDTILLILILIVVIALGLGADLVQVARAMMMSVGCIMTQQCHTNDCPVGVATTVPDKEKGLVVESPTQIIAKHLLYRTENGEIITGEQYVNRMYKPLKEVV